MTWRVSSSKRRRLRLKLRERHGDNCHWCGKPMDFEARDGDAMATIEHLVPRSEGGSSAQTNLRLAHQLCNVDRSHPTPRRCRSPLYEPFRDLLLQDRT